MKYFLTLLLLIVPAAHAESWDMRAPDKKLHIAASGLIAAVVYAATKDADKAIWIPLGIGVAKELYDSRKGGTGFSPADLGANLIGAGAVQIIVRF